MKVADLERLYASGGSTRDLVESALHALRHLDPDLAWRAVWILRRAAADGHVNADVAARVATCAEEFTHWAARLTLCQLFAVRGCPVPAQDSLFPYLVECFADRRPIVRAWALSAMLSLEGNPEFQSEIDACLAQARLDPTPSVQARLRRLKRSDPSRRPDRSS